jgi:hypothetical protein
MIAFVALIVGYVIGAQAGNKDLDQVVSSLKALRDSDEFADVLSAVRTHVGHTLRGLAAVVEGEAEPPAETGGLVERARHLACGVTPFTSPPPPLELSNLC